MPIAVGFWRSAVLLDPPTEVNLWDWNYPMLVGLSAEALAVLVNALGESETVPFADSRNIPQGASFVWAEFEPPVLCKLGTALEIWKLALWSSPNSGQVQRYVGTPSGIWYEYAVDLPTERLEEYHDSVSERHKVES